MAKDKKGFILYADQQSLFDKLPDEIAGKLIKHIYSYVNDEDPFTRDILIEIAFEPIKTQLKRDLKKYESICNRNRENARKRWDNKDATASDRIPKGTKNADIDNDTDKGNDIDKDKVNDINKRKQVFKTQINKTLESDRTKYITNKQDIINFFEYWAEHGINDKKMRFEKEKSFGIARRLDTWFKNKEKFNNKKAIQKDQSDFTKKDEVWPSIN